MTNKEWLEYLANNAPDELAAWFDAEHVENQERALDGDTDAQNADSRDKLEADIRDTVPEWHVDTIIGWLDRQAAITQHEITERWAEHLHPIELECGDLRRKVTKLTSERDKWKANCKDWKKHARAAENACYETMLEREDYRKKFGKCLDYADAIHALMEDGIA